MVCLNCFSFMWNLDTATLEFGSISPFYHFVFHEYKKDTAHLGYSHSKILETDFVTAKKYDCTRKAVIQNLF